MTAFTIFVLLLFAVLLIIVRAIRANAPLYSVHVFSTLADEVDNSATERCAYSCAAAMAINLSSEMGCAVVNPSPKISNERWALVSKSSDGSIEIYLFKHSGSWLTWL